MRTALYCPGCGKPCGSAELLADDADLVHVTTYKEKRRGRSGLPIHMIRGRTLRLSDPDGWPLTWRCEECRTTVVLDRDEATRAVGVMPRLVLGSMPVDNLS